MRGSPLFRAGLVLLALLLLIVPLRSLTSQRAAPTLVPAPPATAPTSIRLTIISTTYPFRFEISNLGKTIWKGESKESSSSKALALSFPPEGIDLAVAASWAQPKETAVRVEVARGENPPLTRTLWGTARVNDVLTFAPSP
jgi:hypothetical protein